MVLPDGEERVIRVSGDRIGGPGGECLVEGAWLLPGLVDVHTHPGTNQPGEDFDEDLHRSHMTDHRDAGVLLVRTPGSVDPDPTRERHDPTLPRVRRGGRWLAMPGLFFPDFGRPVTEADLVDAAVEEAEASGGWCKIIGDWRPGDPAVPLDLLTEAIAAVHAIDGRVAVHAQTAEGSRNAVLARADSIEHGMHLDNDLIPTMVEHGTALVPTFTAFAPTIERIRAGEGAPEIREWLLTGWEGLFTTVRTAHEAGVTVLAGTDSKPCGDIAGEVLWLIRAGLPPEAAVAAASWTARHWLGLPGLEEGAPADIVAYDADPRVDPSVLRRPSLIVLGGQVIGRQR
ncbi:amidohydrolase [Actinokineospora bangkokensis]|uniref:Amidohydrolase n=1 Tax=Actinokineospora bangkokensis TaxID=1193682 RepID=A0A1Q9LJ10_9PSEU|nr:amidohydrolase [Actinokineospora bangkokensis]